MATERAMLDERVEHAQLRNSVDSVRSSFAAGSPHGGVAGWVEEKGILLEKNLAEKRRCAGAPSGCGVVTRCGHFSYVFAEIL
jgi:hypothetical protein